MNVNQSVKKLVLKECACYNSSLNGIKDYCDREHCPGYYCFIMNGNRCGYFEKAVLPINPQLEKLYKVSLQAKCIGYKLTKEEKENILEKESSVKGKVKIHCKRCNKLFEADNYRQQYCRFCKKALQRESKRISIFNKRNSNVDNQPSEIVDI